MPEERLLFQRAFKQCCTSSYADNSEIQNLYFDFKLTVQPFQSRQLDA
jgi:hypothetical protein